MKKTKEKIALWSGVGMLLFGVAITTAGFIVPPLGEVHDSVLWILGQSLIYTGSILGIALYSKHKLNEIETHIYENCNLGDRPRN